MEVKPNRTYAKLGNEDTIGEHGKMSYHGAKGDKGVPGDPGVNPDGTPFNIPNEIQKNPADENFEISFESNEGVYFVNAPLLNVRSDADPTASIVRQLPKGAVVSVSEQRDTVIVTWGYIGDGWVDMQYLTKID